MTGTIKKRVLSLLLAMIVLLGLSGLWYPSRVANAVAETSANTLTDEQIEKAIAWATDSTNVGASYFKRHFRTHPQDTETLSAKNNCTAFVWEAFWQALGSDKSTENILNARTWGNMWTVCTDITQVPPPGALVFYDWYGTIDGKYQNYGHVALSIGDGQVVEGGMDTIQITDYTPHGNCTYTGYGWYNGMNPPESKPETIPTIPTSQAEVESRLADIRNGRYGENTTFPYSSIPVPARLAGEEGETRTFGYARYVFYQVFGIPMSTGLGANQWQLSNSNENLVTIASCGGTSTADTMKADILNTKPGDIIQGKGNGFYQTMIVLSHDENSITILDCDNDYKCTVLVRTRDWAAFSKAFPQYTIYRSKNYPNSGLPTVLISPNGGSFANTQKVTITTEPANSMINIYYTTDGTAPTNKSTKYTGAFTLSESATVKAVAYLMLLKGDVVTATFTKNHTHNWGGWAITTKPTLTTTGMAKRVCQSDSSHVDTYTLPNLTNSLWIKGAAVAATCAAEGSQTYTSAYGSVTIATPKTEHTWGEWSYFPATPAAGAYKMRKCGACGFEQAEDIIEHAHTLQKREAVAATCFDEGSVEFWICSQCSMKFSDASGTTEIANITVPRLGHAWGAYTVTTPATETSAGVETSICERCSGRMTRPIPVLQHTHNLAKREAVAATCFNSGSVEFWICSQCNMKFSDANGTTEITNITVPALGHAWGAYTITTPATETAEGVETSICERCSEEVTRPIPVMQHTHNLAKHEAVPPTCKTAGNSAYWTCSGCNKIFSDENGKAEINKVPTIAATGHKSNNGEITQAPSCTVKGIKTYKCSVCGEILKTEDISATGHNWSEWIIEKPATETDDGVKTRTCQSCGEKQTKPIPAISHTHTLVKHNAVPAACMTNGTDEYWTCSGCEGIFGDESGTKELNEIPTIAVTGHKWNSGKITTPATAESEGIKTYTCTVCGDTKTESIPKLTETEPDTPNVHTHTYSTVWSSDNTNHWHAATCEHTGEVSDKSAHSWNGGEVTKQPTASSEGVKTYTCTVCSKTKTEAIPKQSSGGSSGSGSSGGSGGSGGSSRPNRPSYPSTPTPGTITNDIRVGANAPNGKIKMTADDLIKAVCTSEEQQLIKDGTDCKIILSVNTVDEEFFKGFLGGSDYTVVLVLDIDIFKEFGGSEIEVTETNSEVTLEIEIPEAFRAKGKEFVIIRYHNGERSVLDDLDNIDNTVTFKSDRFSLYGLAYRTETVDPGTSDTSNTSSDNSGSGATSSGESSSTGESGGDTSDSGTTSSGDTSSSDESGTTSSGSTSSGESGSSDSGTSTGDNNNPSTGIAVSIIPLTAALAALTVAVKRRRK